MMKVVAGRSVIKSDADEVIERLEDVIDRVKNGDLAGANRIVISVVQSDVDSFAHTTFYNGRATECLGYIKISETEILRDILGD